MDEKALAELKTSNEAAYNFIMSQKADLEKLKTKPKDDPPADDKDLRERTRLAEEAKEKDSKRTAALEKSLTFNMTSKDFLKNNEALLPKEVTLIFEQAEKEKYADATEKASVLKSSLVQAFFAVQANLELLTPSQKGMLDDYLKLTKNGKQDKASEIYDMVFEPAFETLKRVEKAKALNKSEETNANAGGQDAYFKKMADRAKKRYIGENKHVS